MKSQSSDSFSARLLGQLARAVCHRWRWFLYPQAVLFVLCVLYTVKFLEFDTSRNDLVGANKKYHQNFLKFKKEFPTQDDLVVLVESENPEKNRQFVERLGRKLEAAKVRVPARPGSRALVETNLFKDVFWKGDLKMLGAKALLFISDESPPTVSVGDIRDPASLAAKLKPPSDAVSSYLHGQLSTATRQALTNYQGTTADPAPLLETLTNDLNRILGGPLIFEPQRFSRVALRAKTQQLLAEKPYGNKLAQLNRLLLEDAYPQEISRSDLEELSRMLREYRPFIKQFTRTTNLVSLFEMINTQFRTASRERNEQTDSLVKSLPALERIVAQATSSLRRAGTPPSPGVMALFNPGEEAEQEIYITFAGGKIYLVTAQAPTDTMNTAAVTRMRELVEETRAEVPGLNVGVTGEPVLEIDEMAQSERDTLLATVVAFVLVFLIIIFGYGRISRRIKADACLIVGMAYTMAFTTLVVGHLNILTITFAPILIGIAIDFGVHLIARYEEELQRGRSVEAAMQKALVFTGQGIVTGCLTTAFAFLAMAATSFRGIQEMGVICGGGMLICLVPMMTLLPVLLLRGAKDPTGPEESPRLRQRERIERLWLDRPGWVVVLSLALCGLAWTQYFKVGFDYNLLHMQSDGLPAVECEKKLIHSAAKSVLFGAVIASNVQEAVLLEKELRTLPAVSTVESLATLLNEDQTRKLGLIGEIKADLAPLRFAKPDSAPVNIPDLSRTLYSTGGYLGLAREEALREAPEVAGQLLALRRAIEGLRTEMLRGTTKDQEARAMKLGHFQRALFDDIRETFETLQNQDNRERLRIEDLPLPLRHRFIGITGKVLVQAYPKKDVWQREHQVEFVHQLRSVTSDVTGTPVQLLEYTTLLKDSYEQAACYSLIVVAVLVLLHFHRVLYVGLALLPVGVGFLWMVGIMGLTGIAFNPANIMTLPLVIGIGVTNGIHILNRFAEEQTPSILAKSTGKAVLVSGLTTIAGFGSLALAKHRGIESLGYVMATGTATCMVAGLTLLPALLNLLLRWGALKKQPSADNARSTLGREEPR
jgi:hopanoid biosynthesis associated RND transporter like protein HpnN